VEPQYQDWIVNHGFIANDRRIYTTASNPTSDQTALVVLIPDESTIFRSSFESLP
jgi:type II secretory pathway component PulL